MKPVDWRGLLTEHGVRFVESGPNVKRGELNIQCPFCGTADPSHHLGLNLESGFWACWRNSEHRGKSPLRLLVRLLGISYFQARKLAGLADPDYVDPDGFDAVAARVMGRMDLTKVEHVRREFLRLPPEFKHLNDAPPRFYEYLRSTRQFGSGGTLRLADQYDVRFCTRGDFRDRIIFPYRADEELVAWTGRSIHTSAQVRYRDLEIESCLVPPKQTLFNLDCRLDGGRALVVVEGPIDALKIDVFGRDHAVRAAGLSTNSITDEQIYLLEETSAAFDHVLIMLDTATELGIVDSMRMRQKLRSVRNAAIIPVPYGHKDAGEMSPREATRWAQALSKELP